MESPYLGYQSLGAPLGLKPKSAAPGLADAACSGTAQPDPAPGPLWRLSSAARPALLRREGKDKWSHNLSCDPGPPAQESVQSWDGARCPRGRGACHGALSSCCPCREVCGSKPPRATEPEPLNLALGPGYSKRDRNSLADASGDQPAARPVSAALVYHPGKFSSLDSL